MPHNNFVTGCDNDNDDVYTSNKHTLADMGDGDDADND